MHKPSSLRVIHLKPEGVFFERRLLIIVDDKICWGEYRGNSRVLQVDLPTGIGGTRRFIFVRDGDDITVHEGSNCGRDLITVSGILQPQ